MDGAMLVVNVRMNGTTYRFHAFLPMELLRSATSTTSTPEHDAVGGAGGDGGSFS